MLRDVRSNVTDGLLGFATATGDGLHIKIGVSPSVTEKPITILGSMGKLRGGEHDEIPGAVPER